MPNLVRSQPLPLPVSKAMTGEGMPSNKTALQSFIETTLVSGDSLSLLMKGGDGGNRQMKVGSSSGSGSNSSHSQQGARMDESNSDSESQGSIDQLSEVLKRNSNNMVGLGKTSSDVEGKNVKGNSRSSSEGDFSSTGSWNISHLSKPSTKFESSQFHNGRTWSSLPSLSVSVI